MERLASSGLATQRTATKWADLPTEVYTHVAEFLPVDQIACGRRFVGLGHHEYLDVLQGLAGKQFASTVAEGNIPIEHRIAYRRLVLSLRDLKKPNAFVQSRRDLQNSNFYETVLNRHQGNAGVLRELTVLWPHLSSARRAALRNQLQTAIDAQPAREREHLNQWFRKANWGFEAVARIPTNPQSLRSAIHTSGRIAQKYLRWTYHVALREATAATPELLKMLASLTDRIANPDLRAAEHAALRRAANGDIDILRELAVHNHRIDDPLLRQRESDHLLRVSQNDPIVAAQLQHTIMTD